MLWRKDGKDKAYGQLTPEELRDFIARKSALDQARLHYTMIEEAYRAWTVDIKNKYGLPGQYDIDIRTGKLMPKGSVSA